MEHLGMPKEAIKVVGSMYPGDDEDGEPMSIRVRTPYGDTAVTSLFGGILYQRTIRGLYQRVRRGTIPESAALSIMYRTAAAMVKCGH